MKYISKKDENRIAKVVKEFLPHKKYERNKWMRIAGIIDHNISYKEYIFITTNHNNWYIRFTNVKDTNNIRNMNNRSIDLGGQKKFIMKQWAAT